MKSSTATRALASEVLEFINKHPSQHNQGNWAGPLRGNKDWIDWDNGEVNICNTAMCVAGTAVMINDLGLFAAKLVGRSHPEWRTEAQFSWASLGEAALGLTYDEAQALFYCMDNQAAKQMLEAVAEGDKNKFWQIHNEHDE